MIRNDLQHIQLDSQKSKQEPALHEQEASTAAFFTAEGIELKPTYSEQDIENLDHLDFGAGFLPIYEVPILLCMCVALGPFVNMLDFQQPKKVMLLST
jgi:methylmalonyl-CoA mutase